MSNTIVGSIFLNESKACCARAATYGEIILATGDLGMPPERAFRALTTDEVEKWWASARTCRVTDWKAEFRVDGRWSLIRRLPDGTRLPAGGNFWRSSRPTRSPRREVRIGPSGPGRRTATVTYRLGPLAIERAGP